MITSTINQKIQEAMKARDDVRVSTLRLLSSAFNYERIAKQHELTKEEELVVVKREAKKRLEAIEAYEKAKVQEKADREKEELAILGEFLPKQMSDEELEKIVEEVVRETGATSIADMGKVMGVAMGKVSGRADGGRVSELVKSKLS
ncbi:hypothetical protein A2V56_01675 [Candidatus Woesebacteria bacterium RBG_19FT_COMBO_42_9]|uniref:Glutamyl-tRNA amidotransferase n=1 Tax=Candidatus Woesebacteria bacterium RBG_16_42_24 TaxID=1802485 RepID=A0A1F7XLY5_9BACT|nr:MAG: hypothetical protein A2V97_01595 [Candidatus Woesebacteria bacterium RBG_16_42_24]OGM17537.1 MAG: hypothetical protein A2V56_01675 [Candidatus Woesebacteria bacterium RBG_19FT_COMBO_42_9]OGM67612.1 MAG: hypothetical protein A2985_00405 [Candidatus Woesebacteria bacterium RIFCSPLOWO2_01_FULL_43_11]